MSEAYRDQIIAVAESVDMLSYRAMREVAVQIDNELDYAAGDEKIADANTAISARSKRDGRRRTPGQIAAPVLDPSL